MSKLISDILAAREPDFSSLVQEWENLSGRRGLDVRLSLEIDRRLGDVVSNLGLDSKDSTAQELYHALQSRALRDAQQLAGHIGVHENDNPAAMVDKVVAFVDSLIGTGDVWALKPSVIKRLLHAVPPKKLMKINGQRSIDSVLKRESLTELLALSLRTEPSGWPVKFQTQYKRLKISDFDYQKAATTVVPPKRLEALYAAGLNDFPLIVPVRELGSCLVIPPQKRFRADALVLAYLLLESWREARMYGAFYKALATKPRFGENLMRTIQQGLQPISTRLFGMHWPVIHNYAALGHNPLAQDFGPGLEVDDLSLPSTPRTLSVRLPDFGFWDGHFVGRRAAGGPVSCHLGDVIIDVINQNIFERRTASYLQANLWDEFCARYVAQPAVAEKVLK